jgi:hypothetical protein
MSKFRIHDSKLFKANRSRIASMAIPAFRYYLLGKKNAQKDNRFNRG